MCAWGGLCVCVHVRVCVCVLGGIYVSVHAGDACASMCICVFVSVCMCGGSECVSLYVICLLGAWRPLRIIHPPTHICNPPS